MSRTRRLAVSKFRRRLHERKCIGRVLVLGLACDAPFPPRGWAALALYSKVDLTKWGLCRAERQESHLTKWRLCRLTSRRVYKGPLLGSTKWSRPEVRRVYKGPLLGSTKWSRPRKFVLDQPHAPRELGDEFRQRVVVVEVGPELDNSWAFRETAWPRSCCSRTCRSQKSP